MAMESVVLWQVLTRRVMETTNLWQILTIFLIFTVPAAAIAAEIDMKVNERTKKLIYRVVKIGVLVFLVVSYGVFTPKKVQYQGTFHVSDEEGCVIFDEDPYWNHAWDIKNDDIKKYNLEDGNRVTCTIKEYSIKLLFGGSAPYRRVLKDVKVME